MDKMMFVFGLVPGFGLLLSLVGLLYLRDEDIGRQLQVFIPVWLCVQALYVLFSPPI